MHEQCMLVIQKVSSDRLLKKKKKTSIYFKTIYISICWSYLTLLFDSFHHC
jgi:hypothetical protein